MTHIQSEKRKLAAKLVLLAAGMFGFGYLLVPLYDVFCEITGIGTRTGTPVAATLTNEAPDTNRIVTVEFVATLNQYAPWEFRPERTSIEVTPGKYYDTTYFARNLVDKVRTARAVPSVAPGTANKYFKKVECFCFTAQKFAPGEGRDMGLRFMVDPDLPKHIDRVTLSYTFFDNSQVALEVGNNG